MYRHDVNVESARDGTCQANKGVPRCKVCPSVQPGLCDVTHSSAATQKQEQNSMKAYP